MQVCGKFIDGCTIDTYLALIIRLTDMNVWESMGKPRSCMQFIKAIFCLLQVT